MAKALYAIRPEYQTRSTLPVRNPVRKIERPAKPQTLPELAPCDEQPGFVIACTACGTPCLPAEAAWQHSKALGDARLFLTLPCGHVLPLAGAVAVKNPSVTQLDVIRDRIDRLIPAWCAEQPGGLLYRLYDVGSGDLLHWAPPLRALGLQAALRGAAHAWRCLWEWSADERKHRRKTREEQSAAGERFPDVASEQRAA